MKFNPEIHHRRSISPARIRLFTGGIVFFLTICTHNRECLFGEIADGEMLLNDAGRMVAFVWDELPIRFDYVELDEFVVMPNHFHGILVVDDGRGTARRAPTVEQFGKPVSGSIPTIVRAFKSAVTKRINEIRKTPGAKLWQRNYYEYIIRNENELNRIREYIANNPMRWESDRENPDVSILETSGA